MKHFSLLCLGDSYTIGEQVPLHESFPYQTVQLLRKAHHAFYAPEIIAKTGWTTFELAEHLLHIQLNDHYDFVTLLIGVNNQYRGLSEEDFHDEYEYLLKKALHFTGNTAEHVIALSIPDWGVTPFAREKDQDTIAKEIDIYNSIIEEMTSRYKVHFIDITTAQRIDGANTSFLAGDHLHPSGNEYAKWAKEVFNIIHEMTRHH